MGVPLYLCEEESPLFAWAPCRPPPSTPVPGQPGLLSVAVDCFALSRILHLLKMCQKFFFLIPEECTIGASFHQMTDTFGWFLIFGNCE